MATTTPAAASTAATPAATPTLTTELDTLEGTAKTTLTTAETAVKGAETTAKTWLQKHERIILTALVLLAGYGFGDHWLNVTAAKDQQQANVAMQQVNEQKAKDNQIAQQVGQLTSQYQVLSAQITEEDAKLATQSQTRVTVLHDQQKTDQSLPLPDLGSRWAQIADIAPADISDSTAGITVTDTGARETVTQLEQVPVLQANLTDTQTIVANQKDELAKSMTLTASQTAQIAGLNTTIVDDNVACKAEIKSVKATARKGKLKSFLYGMGVGAGAIVGILIDHKL